MSNVIAFPLREGEPHVRLLFDIDQRAYVVELCNRPASVAETVDLAFEEHQHIDAFRYAMDVAERLDVAVLSMVGRLPI